MSSVKRHMEEQQEVESFISAVNALIKYEVLPDDENVQGIARQLAGDGNVERLTPKQRYHYDKSIAPCLTPGCENEECIGGGIIRIDELSQAYLQQNELGGLYCPECIDMKFQLQALMEEDD